MKKKLLVPMLASVIVLPVSYAGNLSEADAIVFSRVVAYVYPDIARSVCRNQSSETKKRLETALHTSGLTNMPISAICVDGVCLRASGDEKIKRDPQAIKTMIDNFRNEQLESHSKESPEELTRLCTQTVLSLESIKDTKGKKPEEIISEVFAHQR